MSLETWLKSGKYLPPILRDFHDQKDTFKAIHEIVSENDGTKEINWRQAHIYVIDVFLWFMARRGYTLQRSRQKHEFLDFTATIKAAKERRDKAFFDAMKGNEK